MSAGVVRDALADYLDGAARGKDNGTNIYDRNARGRMGVDILRSLAAYVRSLPVDDPALLALAEAHPHLGAHAPHRVFVPRTSAARDLVAAVGTARTGTATEFVLRFVSLETGHDLDATAAA
jgi:hypothetical protein